MTIFSSAFCSSDLFRPYLDNLYTTESLSGQSEKLSSNFLPDSPWMPTSLWKTNPMHCQTLSDGNMVKNLILLIACLYLHLSKSRPSRSLVVGYQYFIRLVIAYPSGWLAPMIPLQEKWCITAEIGSCSHRLTGLGCHCPCMMSACMVTSTFLDSPPLLKQYILTHLCASLQYPFTVRLVFNYRPLSALSMKYTTVMYLQARLECIHAIIAREKWFLVICLLMLPDREGWAFYLLCCGLSFAANTQRHTGITGNILQRPRHVWPSIFLQFRLLPRYGLFSKILGSIFVPDAIMNLTLTSFQTVCAAQFWAPDSVQGCAAYSAEKFQRNLKSMNTKV